VERAGSRPGARPDRRVRDEGDACLGLGEDWSRIFVGARAVLREPPEPARYRASLKTVRTDKDYFTSVDDSRNRAQAGSWAWIQDYPNPIDFFLPILSCRSFLPGDPDNLNAAEFCDRKISREIDQISAIQQSDPSRATALWAKLDREVTDLAPWAVTALRGQIDLVSARVGNYQHSPQSGILIDRLWVK